MTGSTLNSDGTVESSQMQNPDKFADDIDHNVTSTVPCNAVMANISLDATAREIDDAFNKLGNVKGVVLMKLSQYWFCCVSFAEPVYRLPDTCYINNIPVHLNKVKPYASSIPSDDDSIAVNRQILNEQNNPTATIQGTDYPHNSEYSDPNQHSYPDNRTIESVSSPEGNGTLAGYQTPGRQPIQNYQPEEPVYLPYLASEPVSGASQIPYIHDKRFAPAQTYNYPLQHSINGYARQESNSYPAQFLASNPEGNITPGTPGDRNTNFATIQNLNHPRQPNYINHEYVYLTDQTTSALAHYLFGNIALTHGNQTNSNPPQITTHRHVHLINQPNVSVPGSRLENNPRDNITRTIVNQNGYNAYPPETVHEPVYPNNPASNLVPASYIASNLEDHILAENYQPLTDQSRSFAIRQTDNAPLYSDSEEIYQGSISVEALPSEENKFTEAYYQTDDFLNRHIATIQNHSLPQPINYEPNHNSNEASNSALSFDANHFLNGWRYDSVSSQPITIHAFDSENSNNLSAEYNYIHQNGSILFTCQAIEVVYGDRDPMAVSLYGTKIGAFTLL